MNSLRRNVTLLRARFRRNPVPCRLARREGPRSGAAFALALCALIASACESRPRPDGTAAVEDPAKRIERMQSLGYADWVTTADATKKGITRNVADKAAPGYNLFNSRHLATAYLMANDGRILHRWEDPDATELGGWNHTILTHDGRLVAIIEDQALRIYDWNSKRLLDVKIRAHHDMDIAADGSVYVLSRRPGERTWNGRRIVLLEDFVAQIDRRGNTVREIPVYDLFGHRIDPARLDYLATMVETRPDLVPALGQEDTPGDLLHTNNVEVFEDGFLDWKGRPLLLLSVREIDTVAIVDLQSLEVLWEWGPGVLHRQHHPTLVGGREILVYDNRYNRQQSRLLRVDVPTREILWQWTSPTFHSAWGGSVYQLENRDLLVAETQNGRAFELDPTGEIVWEFLDPDLRGPKRAVLYRFQRYPPDYLNPGLLDGAR